MLKLVEAGGVPSSCPQEIQVVQFNPQSPAGVPRRRGLDGDRYAHQTALQPSTTITVAYSNGLIAYVPSKETYDLGGYEVNGSHFYFLKPAPFSKEIEDLIVGKTTEVIEKL